MANIQGHLIQIIGPVLDVRFSEGELPKLHNAVELTVNGKRLVAEVAQHVGDDVVRCIAMASTDGCVRGMAVTDSGAPIQAPGRP